ncbi:MAG: hypothetical protein KBC32_01150 [Candidatus Didemnitutus sp.]|nr:hypothetical protein [Candidatus Didemnitutus sp.]
MLEVRQPTRSAYAIFTRTVCEGMIPAWHDERNLPVVYATELEAQREIADTLMERLQQFLDGEREFEDSISADDFILPVDVWPDGSISTEEGLIFGRRS